MTTPVQKICVVCGKDVAGLKRVKDRTGRYYCDPCHQNLLAKASQPAPIEPDDPPMDFDDLDLAPLPEPSKPLQPNLAAPPVAMSAQSVRSTLTAAGPGGGLACPCCNKNLAAGAKICVTCGIKVPSGRPMITALGRDENQLYGNAEAIIGPLSWLIRFGLYPIASEAYAIKKPIVTWVIAIVTTLFSLYFIIGLATGGENQQLTQLMLWPSRQVITDAEIMTLYHEHEKDKIGAALRKVGTDLDLPDNATEEQRITAAFRSVDTGESEGEFRWYQLFTNVLLHDPSSIPGFVMHLGGNMLFLLIFGTRVNALLGNLKMAILYPLLGAIASGAHLLFTTGRGPALGASGAIMGLAGMYLIFFPVHRVYMAFWLKISWRISTWIKIWPVRGFWVLAFYLSFDVISTILRSRDGVAHWAHLGGFIAGAIIASGLLIARLQDAHHADLFSVLLGKYSWPLIGKPRQAMSHVRGISF